MEYFTEFFNNIGTIRSQFNEEELAPIKNEINQIKKDWSNATPFNNKLAGNLEHEYELTKCHAHVQDLLMPLVTEFNSNFNYMKGFKLFKNSHRIVLDKLWVNFQRKHEFNPLHNHSGVLSFVIWIDIPYAIKDEMSRPSGLNSNNNIPGHFSLVFINSLGEIQTEDIPADRTFNGKIIIFPASMRHCVYPFYTSDEYRVSVSGNFLFDI
jgi:hypothetical protein